VKVVNKCEKKLDHLRKTLNRSSTHIRLKKKDKFELEKWMRKHHLKTYNQAIRKLLELSGAGA
jgi:hypothetical protein